MSLRHNETAAGCIIKASQSWAKVFNKGALPLRARQKPRFIGICIGGIFKMHETLYVDRICSHWEQTKPLSCIYHSTGLKWLKYCAYAAWAKVNLIAPAYGSSALNMDWARDCNCSHVMDNNISVGLLSRLRILSLVLVPTTWSAYFRPKRIRIAGRILHAHLFIRPAGHSFPSAIFHFPFSPAGGSNNLWAMVR